MSQEKQSPAKKAVENETQVKQLQPKVEETQDVQKDPALSPEEEQFLQQRRQHQQRLIQCTSEVNGVLKKYGASIIVDPQSPVGSPRVKVNLN